MFYLKSRSWRRMALNEGTMRGSGSHNVLERFSRVRVYRKAPRLWLPAGPGGIVGFVGAINQERGGDGGQLCLFTTLKTTSTHSH